MPIVQLLPGFIDANAIQRPRPPTWHFYRKASFTCWLVEQLPAKHEATSPMAIPSEQQDYLEFRRRSIAMRSEHLAAFPAPWCDGLYKIRGPPAANLHEVVTYDFHLALARCMLFEACSCRCSVLDPMIEPRVYIPRNEASRVKCGQCVVTATLVAGRTPSCVLVRICSCFLGGLLHAP